MKRREFLGQVVAAVSATVVPGVTRAEMAAEAQPNIVLIMADDLGYECLGCNGSTSYSTPVLDGLAETGVRFAHCHSQPLCTPSRVKIMTGRYNTRNYKVFGVLDPKETTFGHIMQQAGYATCVAGKWQLYGGQSGSGMHPNQAGFDDYCLWQIAERGSRYWDPNIEVKGEALDILEGQYGPDVFCDHVCSFIERHKSEPFFAYYPMCLTHSPFVPTPDSKGGDRDKGSVEYFADMVGYMDKVVGRIMRKLDELGLRENTLVLFTGDNGTHRGITSELGNEVIRGGKGSTISAGTHVPMIASWKGVVPGGVVCDDLVDFSDFLPTIVEAAGASLPENASIDGRSFLPQLRGEPGKPKPWLFIDYPGKKGESKHPGIPPSRFVLDKRWKLYSDGRLYDVRADPLEKAPIAMDKGGEEAAEARKRLQAALNSIQ